MTKRQKDIMLEKLDSILIAGGWKQDRFGNYKLIKGSDEYRIKIQSTSVRYEVKVYHQDNEYSWVRLRGAYLKDISIDENNNLIGLKV